MYISFDRFLNLTSVHHGLYSLDHIGCPVGPDTDQRRGRSHVHHTLMVAHMIDSASCRGRLLAGHCRRHRVHVLCNDHAAFVDQYLCLLLFFVVIAPAPGITDPHHRLGRYTSNAQDKRRVTGNDFCRGVGRNIANTRVLCKDCTAVEHLAELHAGRDAADIARLVDFPVEGMVVVRRAFDTDVRHGGLAERHLGKLAGQRDRDVRIHVDEQDPASAADQVPYRLFRFAGQHVTLEHDLDLAVIFRLKGPLCHDEVGGIGCAFIFGIDKTDFQDASVRLVCPVSGQQGSGQQNDRADDHGNDETLDFHAFPPSGVFRSEMLPELSALCSSFAPSAARSAASVSAWSLSSLET